MPERDWVLSAGQILETAWNRRRILGLVVLAIAFLVHPPIARNRKPAQPKEQPGVHLVTIPRSAEVDIRPVLAGGKAGQTESFAAMMNRLRPLAAINGTYYDERFRPLGDVVIDGKLAVRGHYPNAIAVRNDGHFTFVRRKGKAFDWTGYRAALAAGPRLLRNGKILLDPNADGFRKNALKIKAPRSGVGLTRSGSLVLVVCTDRITLQQFAAIMLRAGAIEAMNMDGGPACGLYHRGRIVVGGGIPMTNILTVCRKQRGASAPAE